MTQLAIPNPPIINLTVEGKRHAVVVVKRSQPQLSGAYSSEVYGYRVGAVRLSIEEEREQRSRRTIRHREVVPRIDHHVRRIAVERSFTRSVKAEPHGVASRRALDGPVPTAA